MSTDTWVRINRAHEAWVSVVVDELLHWLRKQGVELDDTGKDKLADVIESYAK